MLKFSRNKKQPLNVCVSVCVPVCAHTYVSSLVGFDLPGPKVLPFLHFPFARGSPLIHLPGEPKNKDKNYGQKEEDS